ncbi:MAG: hypothetical protein H7256_01075 [Bdellovibrio sp.]|nr:hypothetical protein [Bdellovibrio sp.]
MKKSFLNYFILTVGLVLSTTAMATRDVGNGGVGIYCKDEKDPAKQVQLFDLYEGSVLLKLTPLNSKLDFDNYALSFADQLDRVIGDARSFRERIAGISDSLQFMPSGVGLSLTDDVRNFIYPKACQLVQILNYRNSLVYVDADYWQKLSNTAKAAAILHEAIYAYARERKEDSTVNDGDTTSERTRRAVARLIAGSKLQKIQNYLDPSDVVEQFSCTTPMARNAGRPTADFRIARSSGDVTHVTFTRLGGLTALSSNTIDFVGSIRNHEIRSAVQSLIDSDVVVETSQMDSSNGFTISITRNGSRSTESVMCQSDHL